MTYEIDANGILNVSAKDKDTGAEQRITISESSNLDKSEVERMVTDAERYREEDAALRQLVDARNELDATAHLVERRLAELGAGARARKGPGRNADGRCPAGGKRGGSAGPHQVAHRRAPEVYQGFGVPPGPGRDQHPRREGRMTT